MSKDETFGAVVPDGLPDYLRKEMGHNKGPREWTSLGAIVNTAAMLHQAAVARENSEEAKIDRAMAEVIGFLPDPYVKTLGFDKAAEKARLEALGYKLS